jgi:hypothetical protein
MKAKNLLTIVAILATFTAPARSLEGNSLWSEEATLLQARLSQSKMLWGEEATLLQAPAKARLSHSKSAFPIPRSGGGPGWGSGDKVRAQQAQNVEFVGHIGGATWAVAVQGNYAYVGEGPRLTILDISNPASPTVVGKTDPLPEIVYGVAVAGGYAYVADYYGLRIVDVSDPSNPREVGSYDTPGYAVASDVAVAGGYAYLADTYAGLYVVDVSDPSNPTEVGFYDTPEYAGATGVAVAGRYAYLADGFAGLRIVDVSDPSNPTEVGLCDTPGYAEGVAVAGDYSYVADTYAGLRVVDVSDPSNPTEVGFYDTPGSAIGVAVAGNLAYVADNWKGLRVVDVSDPSNPREVGFYDTPGSAIGVAVAGGYAYVADGEGGMFILRYTGVVVNNPPNQPIGLSQFKSDGVTSIPFGGTTDESTVVLKGDVSDPDGDQVRLQVELRRLDEYGGGFTGEPTHESDWVESGGQASITVYGLINADYHWRARAIDSNGATSSWVSAGGNPDSDADFSVDVGAFTGTISPVWPESNTTLSTVMQGGTAYRHFRLLDSGGSPILNATVTLSTGGTAISDASGYFTATVQADALGGLGSYIISVQSVSYGGQTYSTGGEPSFWVEVNERRYFYSWSYGAKSRLKGGKSAGLILYLQMQNSGGLALILDESNPDIISDDVVLMRQSFSDEIGIGGGVGIEKGVSIGILEIKGGASAVTERYIRTLGNTTTRFPNPYSENDRKAEAIFLLASVIDSLGQAFPGKPFAVGFLKLGLDRFAPYRDYISEQQAGFGAKITPIKVNVGAGASLGLMRGGVTWKERLLGFDLVDLGVTVLTLNSFTDYRDRGEIGLGSEAEFDLDFSLLSWQIWEFQNKFAGTIGEKAKKIKLEVILDADTLDFKRLELSLTGEGNPLAFTDVLKEEVTVKAKIPAEELTWDVLLQTVNVLRLLQAAQEAGYNPLKIGPSAMVNELNALLAPLDYVEYEVTVEDGAETSIETSLGVTFIIKIELGAGLEVKKVRSLVRERGVFINGHPYKTESYEADGYVSRPGKGWGDLTLNALSDLWELVKDAFSWTWKQVTSGVEWVIGTVSKIGGVIQGGARIIAPPGAQLYSPEPGLMASIQQTNPITVTVMGWVPTGVTASGLSPSLAIASGEDFVVGGIYEFSPASLTISPSATLVITYTDEAAAGVDETKLGLFRWSDEGNNWQLLSAEADPPHNIFTATVSQLGTYALGYDGLPPNVSILSPEDGSTITNTLPLISALVTDRGVGINHGRVVMMLDGEIVAHSYITSTGQVSYLPPEPLKSGSHTVEVMAEDVVGNASASSATFTVEVVSRIYLPIVLKKL